MVEQQIACRALLARKDALVQALQKEVKDKDAAYNELLTQQSAEVTELLARMNRELATLHETQRTQLNEVEEKLTQDRKALLASNKKELNELFDKRREMEVAILERAQKRDEEFQAEITRVRAGYAEDYSRLKVTLENNIQLLEQQLAEMRATYQLNTEKLEYNHRVLRELDTENKETVKHHKMRLKRLKDALHAHAERYGKQDARFKAENEQLTQQYERVTQQFKDLQRKCQHFERLDAEKYHQLSELNETDARNIVTKLLKADQVITTQLLGLSYAEPPHVAALLAVRSASEAAQAASDRVSETADGAATPAKAAATADAAERGTTSKDGGSSPGFSPQQVRSVLTLLVQELGFLLDEKLVQQLQALSPEERVLLASDTVVSALGVTDKEDLHELVALFFESPAAAEMKVHANDTVRIVRGFLESRSLAHAKLTGDAGAGAKPVAKQGGGRRSSNAHGRASSSSNGGGEGALSRERRERRRQEEVRKWQAFASVLGEEKLGTWKALEKGLERYCGELEQRSRLGDEVAKLRRENEEMKGLLEQYVRAPITRELQIPPTRVIRLQN